MLELLEIPFQVVRPLVDESVETGEAPVDFVSRIAWAKGEAVAADCGAVAAVCGDAVVLSADTIVTLDDRIFGKPRSREDAFRMLTRLSGREHSVYTAVSAIQISTGRRSEGVRETRVWFRVLEPEWIEDYLNRENVLDKAGAYAIQGFASVFVPRIEGDYTNVIGLPLGLTWDLLAGYGLTCRSSS